MKEVGFLRQGKPVDYAWAFWAIHMLAQKVIDPMGMAIDEETDEARVVKIHNETTAILRKLQEKAASEVAAGGPPFRRNP